MCVWLHSDLFFCTRVGSFDIVNISQWYQKQKVYITDRKKNPHLLHIPRLSTRCGCQVNRIVWTSIITSPDINSLWCKLHIIKSDYMYVISLSNISMKTNFEQISDLFILTKVVQWFESDNILQSHRTHTMLRHLLFFIFY